MAVLAVMLIVILAGVVYLLTLPGVGDAESRVQKTLAAHDATASGLPPPPRLGAAVVAIEDQHFYSNFVINILSGVGRAGLAAVSASGDPGGATIPQQLAKQLYGPGSGLTGTLRDIGLAVKLSLDYSQAKILSMYLNAIYYGNGYWGDEAAAHGYFHTSPYRLTWAEAAMLGGLPQAPSDYDPLRHFTLAKERQQRVAGPACRHACADGVAGERRLSDAASAGMIPEPLAPRLCSQRRPSSRGGQTLRGKSGHHRARWSVTPTRGNPRESATEKTPPKPGAAAEPQAGKGEMVR